MIVAQYSGVVMNISSESGSEGSDGQGVYAATNSAVNSLTRSRAMDLGKHGFRVVGVASGILKATALRTRLCWPTRAASALTSFVWDM